ncbi:MAG: transposase, partial [Candidatus Thermoplasmatota archaeon]|nr:transposase [Candidatus Thermoplasmatota archaeon]
ILHPFGRDLEFKPHVHVLVTEGGFDSKVNFYPRKFYPARAMRKTWQYQVLTRFKKALPKTREYAKLINSLFKTYDGFYVWLPKESRIESRREISKYVGRYIRHPAVANSRICRYDGKEVTFWWRDNGGEIHYKTMSVDEFIKAIIQHIPERQFRLIRYYGAYNRRDKRIFKKALQQSTIAQTKLFDFDKIWRFRCPKCGSKMEVIWYMSGHPPPDINFGEKIEDWNYI